MSSIETSGGQVTTKDVAGLTADVVICTYTTDRWDLLVDVRAVSAGPDPAPPSG